jgi:acyl carrier protein
MNKQNLDILVQIFLVVFDLSEDEEISSFRKLTNDKWDSLRQVSLVAALESEFSIKIDTSESELITSFKAVTALLEEKGL